MSSEKERVSGREKESRDLEGLNGRQEEKESARVTGKKTRKRREEREGGGGGH